MAKELHIPDRLDLAEFISREAHDLKSPFNRALGFQKLVMDGFDGPISEQAAEDLAVAYKNTQHTLVTINALVDAARLGRAESGLVPESHSLETLIAAAIDKWQRQYHKANPVEITFNAPDVLILADDIMIRQCFQHWISYVNEYVQKKASIQILVEEATESLLFTFRGRGSKQEDPSACDLTLYGFVALGILDLHGGQILKLEEDHQGAVVQFSLPKGD